MKYSIKVGKVINGTNVEFIATDIAGGDFHFVKDDLIKQINELGGSAPVVETDYKPATNFVSAYLQAATSKLENYEQFYYTTKYGDTKVR